MSGCSPVRGRRPEGRCVGPARVRGARRSSLGRDRSARVADEVGQSDVHDRRDDRARHHGVAISARGALRIILAREEFVADDRTLQVEDRLPRDERVHAPIVGWRQTPVSSGYILPMPLRESCSPRPRSGVVVALLTLVLGLLACGAAAETEVRGASHEYRIERGTITMPDGTPLAITWWIPTPRTTIPSMIGSRVAAS